MEEFEVLGLDVFGPDPPGGADEWGGANGVVAVARTDVGDPRAGVDAGDGEDAFGLAGLVAVVLVTPAWGDDGGDRA